MNILRYIPLKIRLVRKGNHCISTLSRHNLEQKLGTFGSCSCPFHYMNSRQIMHLSSWYLTWEMYFFENTKQKTVCIIRMLKPNWNVTGLNLRLLIYSNILKPFYKKTCFDLSMFISLSSVLQPAPDLWCISLGFCKFPRAASQQRKPMKKNILNLRTWKIRCVSPVY